MPMFIVHVARRQYVEADVLVEADALEFAAGKVFTQYRDEVDRALDEAAASDTEASPSILSVTPREEVPSGSV